MEALSKAVTTHLLDVTKSVDSNYNSLNCRLGYMIDDRKQEEKPFNNFVKNTNEILNEKFLNQVMPTKHEGDTPARQPEIKRKVFDSIAPREVLLQRFSANLESTFDEEVIAFTYCYY